MEPLERIFKAKSVAIIGASKDETKRGFQAIKTLVEGKYEGEIFPVNPHEETILGLKCYKNILDIKEPVDVALVVTPAHTVPAIIEECGRAGAAGAVVIAGGFGETGEEGKKIAAGMVKTARKYGMRIIGPNTSGMISLLNNMNLVGLKDVPRGNIALLTQSGNIALHIITEASLKSREGFSYSVGVGNEADLQFHEYLKYFRKDPHTKAILMYVEGLRNGRKFLQHAYNTTTKKPVILLKSGRSSTGKKSAGSHTGALAGISEVAKTAFERAGIITIERSCELFPAAECLSILPPIKNNKIAILADGGGHATIAADLLSDFGVELPELQESTREQLRKILPANASLRNPVDVAGGTDSNPAIFASCAKILLRDENIGGLLIVGLFGGYGIRFSEQLKFIEEDAAHQMGKLVKKIKKPLVLHSLYNFAKPHSLELLRYYKIPVYEALDIACKCIKVLAQYGNYLGTCHNKTNFVFKWGAKAKPQGREIIDNALREGREALLEYEVKDLLRLHETPVSKDRLAKNEDEAVRFAAEFDTDVVLKIVSPDILHKSDAGGVKLGLKNEEEVRAAFREILKNAKKYNSSVRISGCLVSPMAEKGVEIIIGTKVDGQFGPVIMYGIGGILVEVVKDVAFRVLPVSRHAAEDMIKEIKSAQILDGVRGEPPVNKENIVDLILKVSDLIESYPEIYELDLNPVIARENSLTIVDARMIIRKNHKKNGSSNFQGSTPHVWGSV
ncbi:MAG: acetate--CoA ligase family protein [Candidatus Aminicenantes bacterium]|nr:acetate--CoA ligase family protein [Candidatus Aminicenantes bacterium]